jgi:RsiW-degrading membrane proteinase PrsW (M82 family)
MSFFRRWVAAALAAVSGVCLASLLGCAASPSVALSGTNDASLGYDIEADPTTGKTMAPALAREVIKARLSAAQIIADVAATARGVRVTVDETAAPAVDSLVLWRGGLRAYRADREPPGAEVDLGLGPAAILSIEPALRGRAIAIAVTPGALDPLWARDAAAGDGTIAFARGRTVLAKLSRAQALAMPIVVPFGDDITAYGRAYRTRLLLESPTLPPLRRTTVTREPPNFSLAAACALFPCAISLAWLAFVRRFDRARPEPVWLVLATFALGGLAVVPAGLAEYAFAAATPWLDPSVVTLGGQAWALPLAIAVFTLVVGASEEGFKFLGAWSLAKHRREFDEPVDGIVYGCAAALGFAAIENVKYFALGRMSGAVIAMRGFVTVPAHMFFGAIWGYAMGQTLVSRKPRMTAALAAAAVAHGTFDAVLSTDGIQLAAAGLVLLLAITFIALLQRALQHGAVPPRSKADEGPSADLMPASQMPRSYFRVGSSGTFYAAAGGMIASAFAATILGAAYELLHHRVGIVFVGIVTVILVLFGLAAYATSATIPLDVVIDAQGVTFAGGRMGWSEIRGFDVVKRGKRAYVALHTGGASLLLGPAANDVARRIADCIGGGTRGAL